tara:strand:+ start:15730 stop:15885 length:156 start_codon:yes stop_codon:yes gene_type:complete
MNSIEREKEIKNILSELQCMNSCLAQGFTLKMYIESQMHLVDILTQLDKEQ